MKTSNLESDTRDIATGQKVAISVDDRSSVEHLKDYATDEADCPSTAIASVQLHWLFPIASDVYFVR